MPVCIAHAIEIGERVRDYFTLAPDPAYFPPREPRVERRAYVYYLMLSPTIVKIGTTRSLLNRLTDLRTDLQYVVALELGDGTVERQRHREFATERFGRRENFQLSERLKRHIDELQPERDALVLLATTHQPAQ